MNKNVLLILFGFLVIGLLSAVLVTAPGEEGAKALRPQGAAINGGEVTKVGGNMTFGQCVSDGAVVKNTCYQAVKDAKDTCYASAKNQTDSKTLTKKCLGDYKLEKKQCKADFKQSKNQCKKIKHNAFESMGAAFK